MSNVSVPPLEICNALPDEVRQWFKEQGYPAFRADQLLGWVFQKGERNIDNFSNMSKTLRDELRDTIILPQYTIVEIQRSAIDNTRKILLELPDGARIETVIIPVREKLSQCLSTQVGCRMGCTFCATAGMGFARHLSAAEILAQVFAVQDILEPEERITNFVFMGMGEPLDNYDNTVRAIRIITDPDMLGYSHRHVTLSTCGLVDKIKRLGDENVPCHLAISLHGVTDEQRSKIMPVNRAGGGLQGLLDVLRNYPMQGRKRITIEYILIGGVNDSIADARKLAKLLAPIRCKINLIPYNPHPGAIFQAPSEASVLAFQKVLIEKNYTAMIRKSGGSDIDAACGQLAGKKAKGD